MELGAECSLGKEEVVILSEPLRSNDLVDNEQLREDKVPLSPRRGLLATVSFRENFNLLTF
jgi:hypothetical protein